MHELSRTDGPFGYQKQESKGNQQATVDREENRMAYCIPRLCVATF